MLAKASSFQAFCIRVVVNSDKTRDVFVREVESCEARSHMSIDEIESFVATELAYTAAEKVRLLHQVNEIRCRMSKGGVGACP